MSWLIEMPIGKTFLQILKIKQKSRTTEEETAFQKEEEKSEQQLPHPSCWGGGAHVEDRGAGQKLQQGQGNMEQWGHYIFTL